jgi:hypothetical protein
MIVMLERKTPRKGARYPSQHGLSQALVALAAILLVGPALASEPDGPRTVDFGPDLPAWNGLGYLVETAREARVELTASGDIDLATAAPGDLLVAIQPASLPAPDQLTAFIAAGGLLVLATEGPRHADTLAALGLSRVPPPPGFDTEASLPTAAAQERPPTDARGARPRAAGPFLFFRADALALNHPDALIAAPGAPVAPILSFPGAPDRHVVVEVRLGLGLAIVVADASSLVNDMLRIHYGNKQFAATLLRYPCEREPCRARLVTGVDRLYGTFDASHPVSRTLREHLARVNRITRDLSAEVASPGLVWPLLGLLAVGLLASARALGVRLRSTRSSDDPPAPAPGPPPPLATALGVARRRGSAEFGPLALALASTALERLGRCRTPPTPLVADAASRLAADRAALTARGPMGISAERFERMHGDADTVLSHALRSRTRR